MKNLINLLTEKTYNFEKGYFSATSLGWSESKDEYGRPLNCDPNYRTGNVKIYGKKYWFIRKRWTVKVWNRKADYLDYMNGANDFILLIDLTPDYLK